MKTLCQYAIRALVLLSVAAACAACDEENPESIPPVPPVGSSLLPGGRLVAVEVVNLTAYSFDLEVTKAEACTRYVVGGYRATVDAAGAVAGGYDEEAFVASARLSLAPDAGYPFQPFNVFDRGGRIPERLMVKGRPASSSESEGLAVMRRSDGGVCRYTIAVYAVDAEGNCQVETTPEFGIPDPVFTAPTTVEIDPVAGMNDVTATFTASEDCAKVVCGCIAASEVGGDENSYASCLSQQHAAVPFACEGEPVTLELDTKFDSGTEVIVYAIPVSRDGHLGELRWETVATQRPELNGPGGVDLELREVTSSHLTLGVTLTGGAEKVRILCMNDKFYEAYAPKLGELFLRESSPGGARPLWDEYAKADLEKTDNLVTLGPYLSDRQVIIRAVGVTADGAVGRIVSGPACRTLPEASAGPAGSVSWEGTGRVVRFSLVDTQWVDEAYARVTADIGADDNAEGVYLYPVAASDTEASIRATIVANCYDEDAGALRFGSVNTPARGLSGLWRIDGRGVEAGRGLAVVTRDREGAYSLEHIFILEAE